MNTSTTGPETVWTCRDWFQLSLKEGLTVFRDQEFSSDTGSHAVNRINNVKFLPAWCNLPKMQPNVTPNSP